MSINKPFKIKNGLNAGRLVGERYSTPTFSTKGDDLTSAGYMGLKTNLNTITGNTYTSFQGGDIVFNDDGTIMYSVNYDTTPATNTPVIYQYSLSVPYDISTLTLTQSVYTQPIFNSTSRIYHMDISRDGRKMITSDGGNIFREINLSTPWDISTISSVATIFLDGSGDLNGNSARSLKLDPTGTRMTVAWYDGAVGYSKVRTFVLAEPFSFAGGWTKLGLLPFQLNSGAAANTGGGFNWNEDGTAFYVLDLDPPNNGGALVKRFECTTPYDVSTFDYTVFTSYELDAYISSSENLTSAKLIDNNKLIILTELHNLLTVDMGNSFTYDLNVSESNHYELDMKTQHSSIEFDFKNIPEDINSAITLELIGAVQRYDIDSSTAARIDVANCQVFPVGVEKLISIPDGTKIFEVDSDGGGGTNDRIRELIVGDPYNISNVGYTGENLSVNSQTTSPQGGTFSSDGYRLYVVGAPELKAFQYNLTTPFDISTATYSTKSLDLNDLGQGRDMTISPDGKFIIAAVSNVTNNYIRGFRLSTPWELDSASLISSIEVGTLNSALSNLYGVYVSNDGFTLYIHGVNDGTTTYVLKRYSLKNRWDLNSIDESNPSAFATSSTPIGAAFVAFGFNHDGSKLLYDNYQFDARGQQQVMPIWPTNVKWEGGIAPLPPNEGKRNKYVFLTQGKKSSQRFEYTLSNDSSDAYTIAASTDRIGTIEGKDPSIRVYQGDVLVFNNTVESSHPMYIKTRVNRTGDYTTNSADIYKFVDGNGTDTVTFNTGSVEPGTYYYQCSNHGSMMGKITVMPNEEKIYGKLISQGITA
jgi:plastocyanin